MKSLITISLLVLSLSGCADKASTQMGSEALVYQELHHFVIEPKRSGSKTEVDSEFTRIIASFHQGFEQTNWHLGYRYESDKPWVTSLEMSLLNLGLNPARIHVEKLQSGNRVIDIRVGQYKLKSQECRRSIFGEMGNDVGCYVDSMRLKQVRDVQTLAAKEGL
ncbi:hypothetical protein [Shewanella woodyi]|uniref:Lipoprotein n=1 Tax=Shewanella woodyi (strain ATCC 51908 / MS32) TaxID=392500 RepID=B1KR85_SHEWM|nr:hypothetical protein [Shewanella woodyi]ACA84902.1 hypothetical protein Swoo_0606 [Shewanella woodyi ATCC 51908]